MATSKQLPPEHNPDLQPHSSLPSMVVGSRNFGSINMDDLLDNIYADAAAAEFPTGQLKRTAPGAGVPPDPNMTLEDFLTQAGAVSEEELRVPAVAQPVPEIVSGEMMHAAQFSSHPLQGDSGGYAMAAVGFENGIDAGAAMNFAVGGSSGVGRGKRRAVEEPVMDKVSQQRQKRMIKNRESAARSRDRKHAYTVELEALVMKLEEEKAQLLREEAERNRERYRLLMENLIPVVEKGRAPRVLRRVRSMCW